MSDKRVPWFYDEKTALDRMLENEDRIQREARMLPTGTLSEAQRESTRKAVSDYVKRHELRLRDVVKQVPSVGKEANLSSILSGTYKAGKLDDHLRELNAWMEVDHRRRATKPDASYVQTRVAKAIAQCANKASQARALVVAHGPTGIGKSMVAHALMAKFPGTIYLRISSGNTSTRSVSQMLSRQVRINPGRPRRGEPTGLTRNERIFDRLRGSHRLIVIDEAHRISDGALEFLRDVNDETQCPILFLSTKDFIERIRNDNDEDHGQLYSRFVWVRDLTMGYDKQPGGTKPLFTVAEIRELFESDKVRLAPDAQAYLQDVANMLGHGSLRRCRFLMFWATALERTVRKAGPDVRITVKASALRKVEHQAMHDGSMQSDIDSRHLPVAKTA